LLKTIGIACLSLFLIDLAAATELGYCVPVKKIDFNPYREINDGKELAYLTLLRSYISTEKSEPGLLAAYEFSPDGKIFTGRIAAGLNWSDGTAVTPQELAHGISKALAYRSLGQRVKVLKSETIDPSTFKITFSTDIQNPTGVLREALSTNSRHNRFWPVKEQGKSGNVLVLGKFPQLKGTSFVFEGHEIKIQPADGCAKATMSIFPEFLPGSLEQYHMRKSPTASAIFLQTNSVTLNLQQRQALISVVRKAFANASTSSGITPVESFFLIGEPGFMPKKSWSRVNAKLPTTPKPFVLGYEHPFFAAILKNIQGLKLIQLPTAERLDGQLLASGIQNGRLVILQDILKWEKVESMLKNAPLSSKSLAKIAALSASTIPPDNQVLARFEDVAMAEASLAPVARRNPMAYSRQGTPVTLDFNSKGEITFAKAPQ